VDKQGIIRWIKRYDPGTLPDNHDVLTELRKLR
jgi:hypothetical protein